ncbi:COMM domain-containing protein 6 isoform X1 [Urocitellus parryii]
MFLSIPTHRPLRALVREGPEAEVLARESLRLRLQDQLFAFAMEASGSQEPILDAKSQVTNQLVDFQWKLGMAVSSDSCRSLKYPYVAVMLKVADHSGQVKNKSFEMTIPQFQNFYRQFKDIAAIIETV